MDHLTLRDREPEAPPAETASPVSTTYGATGSDTLFINSKPGYPGRVAIARYFRDAREAAAVEQLVWVVLGRWTDGLLHYGQAGTSLVLRKMSQAQFWGGTLPLLDLIRPLNHWLTERAEILKGKRAVERRIAKSDSEIDGFGYQKLRRTLLGLACKRPRKLQILDAAGGGGILEIPPRALLVPVRKTDAPNASSDGTKVLSVKHFTQVLDPSGALVETLTAHVASGVVEGRRAHVRHPRKGTILSRHTQHVNVIHENQERNNEDE